MFCAGCGSRQQPDWLFCGTCGRPAAAPTAVTPTPATIAAPVPAPTITRSAVGPAGARVDLAKRPEVPPGAPGRPGDVSASIPGSSGGELVPVAGGLLFLAGAPFAFYGGQAVLEGTRALIDAGSGGLFDVLAPFAYFVISLGLFLVFLGLAHAWVAMALTQRRPVAVPAGVLLCGTLAALVLVGRLGSGGSPFGAGSDFESDLLPWLVVGAEMGAFGLVLACRPAVRTAGAAVPTTIALGQAMAYFFVASGLAVGAALTPFATFAGAAALLGIGGLLFSLVAAAAARAVEKGRPAGRTALIVLAVVHCGALLLALGETGLARTATGLALQLIPIAWGPVVIGLLTAGEPARRYFAGPPAAAG